MSYDYKAGRKRVREILEGDTEIIENEAVPSDSNFTFVNSYYSWVTAIFVDIRDSTILFSDHDKVEISRVIRSFTSETIEILRHDENLREIGIRGDCVYGIYTTPSKNAIAAVMNLSYYVNTFMKMHRVLLGELGLPQIKVGIGVSSAQELVIKAGRKDTGINSNVWIGGAVSKASKLSSLGSQGYIKPIVLSELTHDNMIECLVEESGEQARGWFHHQYDNNLGDYYHANIIITGFDDWIEHGMQD